MPARITSFSRSIVTPWKENISLSCNKVGVPTPSTTWSMNGATLESTLRKNVSSDGTLIIRWLKHIVIMSLFRKKGLAQHFYYVVKVLASLLWATVCQTPTLFGNTKTSALLIYRKINENALLIYRYIMLKYINSFRDFAITNFSPVWLSTQTAVTTLVQ